MRRSVIRFTCSGSRWEEGPLPPNNMLDFLFLFVPAILTDFDADIEANSSSSSISESVFISSDEVHSNFVYFCATCDLINARRAR